MIDYGPFAFCAPPRTGTTWFIKAAYEAGLGSAPKTRIHTPPTSSYNGLVVSLVRHPYHWLESIYYGLEGGFIGVQQVDKYASIARQSEDFADFVNRCIEEHPKGISQAFDSYRANSVLRLEDFPWAAVEFFESIGAKKDKLEKVAKLPPQNARKGEPVFLNKKLKDLVVQAEKDLYERYNYQ